MAGKYFTNFPLELYSNTVSVNLLTKLAFQKKVDEQFYVFHPYTIKDGDRPDTIAFLYYGDPTLDWVVKFSNEVIDPYYDWYLDVDSFKRFINEKYGSVAAAQSKVKFFRTNYYADFSVITPQTYANLSAGRKKYWNPILSINGSVSGYERKKEDIQHSTNRVQQLNITVQGNTQFTSDENVYQLSGQVTSAVGSVKFANTSTLIVDSIQGAFSNTVNVRGTTSTANAVVSTITTLSTTIPSDETIYYEAVTYYDYENEKNEKKKNIKLLDASYIPDVLRIFKELTNV